MGIRRKKLAVDAQDQAELASGELGLCLSEVLWRSSPFPPPLLSCLLALFRTRSRVVAITPADNAFS